jgi:hypothetical protein
MGAQFSEPLLAKGPETERCPFRAVPDNAKVLHDGSNAGGSSTEAGRRATPTGYS